MVDLVRPTVCTTLEEVQAFMMTGLPWVTQDGAGKMCILSLSRYEYSPTRLTNLVISGPLRSLEICGIATTILCLIILLY